MEREGKKQNKTGGETGKESKVARGSWRKSLENKLHGSRKVG